VPRGPKGEKRPADVIGNAVHVMRVATGEIKEEYASKDPTKTAGAAKGGTADSPVDPLRVPKGDGKLGLVFPNRAGSWGIRPLR